MSKEDIRKLTEDVRSLKRKVAQLEETMHIPPSLASLIKRIQERGVVTTQELQREGFLLYGGNRTRLYEVLRSKPKFRVVPGLARHATAVIAYMGNEELREDPSLMAVDYLLQIPVARRVSVVSDTGKRHSGYRGQEGSLEGIMQVYKITKERAYEVWQEIRRLFSSRIEEDKLGKKTFLRKY